MFLHQFSIITRTAVRNMSKFDYLPTQRFKDKVAVVTASSSGIGLAIATRLGLEGAKVSICSRQQKNVDNALDELKLAQVTAKGITCDVGKATDREKLYKTVNEEFGGIDILIANTGTSTFGHVLNERSRQSGESIILNY